MPFLQFETNNPDIKIGLWRLEESEMFFLTRLKLYEHEWLRLSTLNHPQKRLEWLSSRLCLKEILNISHLERVESLNAQNGKPYLSNHSHKIGYTHSMKYAAAIASPTHDVGIDLEYLHRRRNMQTKTLFMNEAELDTYERMPSMELFLTIWSAKETIYKLYSQRGISFKNDIVLELSSLSMENKGIIKSWVMKEGVYKSYFVHYTLFPEFVMTYACDVETVIDWTEIRQRTPEVVAV